LVLAALAASVAQRQVPAQPRLSETGADKAGVYALLLREEFIGYPIVRRHLPLAALLPDPSRDKNGVPDDLIAAARARLLDTEPGTHDPTLFPAGTQWISESDSNPRSRLDLSDVTTTADRLNALVIYRAICGPRCGDAGYLWLQRATASSSWTVKVRSVKLVY
jgi:hypothetical protein